MEIFDPFEKSRNLGSYIKPDGFQGIRVAFARAAELAASGLAPIMAE
jgi:hypothetical protein